MLPRGRSDKRRNGGSSQGIAADIHLEGDKGTAETAIRVALGHEPVDVVVQPAATRRKRLFLADMDSTMIGQECIDELADYVGLKEKVSAITERAMRGEIAFEPALRERVALLKDLPVGVIDEIIGTRITLTPGGRELVGTMRANGAYAALRLGRLHSLHGTDRRGHRVRRTQVEPTRGGGRTTEG